MDRTELRADCSKCVALCCVSLGFAASADFAIDKPPGVPCPNLQQDFGCGIHATLRESGFAGCTVYDCFGAGQRVTQQVYRGRSWRTEPQLVGDMGAALIVMEQLHAMLWYLADARDAVKTAGDDGPLSESVDDAIAAVEALADTDSSGLTRVPVEAAQRAVDRVLDDVSAAVRSGFEFQDLRGADLRGADLRGADLRRADLAGARLRGGSLQEANLEGADLRGADLRRADLRAARLRGADLRGANMLGALYLTRGQLRIARGDAHTVLPRHLEHPRHWAAV